MLCATSVLAIFSANAQVKSKAAKPVATAKVVTTSPFKNAVDSFSYAVGMSIGESLKQAGADKINTTIIAKALNDVYGNGKTLFTKEEANNIVQQKLQQFQSKKGEGKRKENTAFFEKNKKKAGVISLPNGLQYEIIKAGEENGLKPKAIDTVVVNYVGTLTDGTEFDNSVKRGQAATFPLNGVIRGWTEILQLMTKGSHWKVYIPSELGYGEHPQPGSPIKPNDILVFEITLEDIKVAVPAETK